MWLYEKLFSRRVPGLKNSINVSMLEAQIRQTFRSNHLDDVQSLKKQTFNLPFLLQTKPPVNLNWHPLSQNSHRDLAPTNPPQDYLVN